MSTATKKRSAQLDRVPARVRGGEQVVLRRGGQPAAAVVPIEDLDRPEELEDQEDIRGARAALKEADRKGTTPWQTVKAELGLK